MSKQNKTLFAAITVAVGFVLSGLIVADGLATPPTTPVTVVDTVERRSPATPDDALSVALALNDAFVSLTDRVKPGVVRIEVRAEGPERATTAPQFGLPEPFRRFFEMPLPENGGEPSPRMRVGGGTGFLISDDGYIVTNHHVVSDADEITVWLENRLSYDAELIGSDPTTDVAVIRIEGDDFPGLSWGSSDDVRVGEWVVAIGNPGVGNGRPLDYTVTAGIVSAKDRPLELLGRGAPRAPGAGPDWTDFAIENFIQTDAVINPGNSGGPLLDLRGNVVGINTAIASTSGYYQGYGFAVPADLARRVAEDLIEDGVVERAWLGVSVSGVTPEDAELYALPSVAGVLVQQVTEGGPAEEAGVEREDVIVGVDGEPVDRGGGLQQLVAERRPGQSVTLQIVRDGEARELRVELGEAPIRDAGAPAAATTARAAALDRLGIEVENLTARVADELGYDAADGVIVRDVDPVGPGARRGVVPGWKVVEVNRTAVSTVREVERALEGVAEGDVVRLLLESPAGQRRVANVRAR